MHCGDQRHLGLCLGYVPALAYGSCRVSDQGTTLRASDLHNARATILNPFNIYTHTFSAVLSPDICSVFIYKEYSEYWNFHSGWWYAEIIIGIPSNFQPTYLIDIAVHLTLRPLTYKQMVKILALWRYIYKVSVISGMLHLVVVVITRSDITLYNMTLTQNVIQILNSQHSVFILLF